MRTEVNPIVVVVVLAVVIAGAIAFLWTKAQGPTFSKSDARGRMDLPIGRPAGK